MISTSSTLTAKRRWTTVEVDVPLVDLLRAESTAVPHDVDKGREQRGLADRGVEGQAQGDAVVEPVRVRDPRRRHLVEVGRGLVVLQLNAEPLEASRSQQGALSGIREADGAYLLSEFVQVRSHQWDALTMRIKEKKMSACRKNRYE